jgi:hypothetical protein
MLFVENHRIQISGFHPIPLEMGENEVKSKIDLRGLIRKLGRTI